MFASDVSIGEAFQFLGFFYPHRLRAEALHVAKPSSVRAAAERRAGVREHIAFQVDAKILPVALHTMPQALREALPRRSTKL